MADTECTECHSNNMKFDIETCVGCHDDTYKAKLTEYKNNYKAKFDEASKLYEEITKAIAEGKNPGASEAILKRAEFNFKYASLDGSKGMHNPDFTDSLFTKVMADLNEVKNALK
ncbi:hypothetical protein HY745_09445 [Candidatus Desantisbacteria bacterium]|nr:hypothetical protein [Candidatus Desantisbacteria bacterium]